MSSLQTKMQSERIWPGKTGKTEAWGSMDPSHSPVLQWVRGSLHHKQAPSPVTLSVDGCKPAAQTTAIAGSKCNAQFICIQDQKQVRVLSTCASLNTTFIIYFLLSQFGTGAPKESLQFLQADLCMRVFMYLFIDHPAVQFSVLSHPILFQQVGSVCVGTISCWYGRQCGFRAFLCPNCFPYHFRSVRLTLTVRLGTGLGGYEPNELLSDTIQLDRNSQAPFGLRWCLHSTHSKLLNRLIVQRVPQVSSVSNLKKNYFLGYYKKNTDRGK